MNVTRRGALSLVAASIGMGYLQACGKVTTDAGDQGQAEAAAPASEAPATLAFPDDQRIAQARQVGPPTCLYVPFMMNGRMASHDVSLRLLLQSLLQAPFR